MSPSGSIKYRYRPNRLQESVSIILTKYMWLRNWSGSKKNRIRLLLLGSVLILTVPWIWMSPSGSIYMDTSRSRLWLGVSIISDQYRRFQKIVPGPIIGPAFRFPLLRSALFWLYFGSWCLHPDPFQRVQAGGGSSGRLVKSALFWKIHAVQKILFRIHETDPHWFPLLSLALFWLYLRSGCLHPDPKKGVQAGCGTRELWKGVSIILIKYIFRSNIVQKRIVLDPDGGIQI